MNNDLDNACRVAEVVFASSSSARVFVWTRSWTLIADTFHGQDSLIVAVTETSKPSLCKPSCSAERLRRWRSDACGNVHERRYGVERGSGARTFMLLLPDRFSGSRSY